MGNILKVVRPVAGVKDDTSGADLRPHADVNNSPAFADEVADTCITSLHATLVELLDGKLCPKSPIHSKLKEMLATVEQQMHRHAIPLSSLRQRSLWDVLNEDWLEPHCNFPDSVDFWPPPPPRFLQWRTAFFSRPCVTSLHINGHHCVSEEEVEKVSGFSVDEALHGKDIHNVDETQSPQEKCFSQLRQASYFNCAHPVETGMNSSKFTLSNYSVRPATLADKICTENCCSTQPGLHVHNIANDNVYSSVFCDEKCQFSQEQSTIVNGECSQKVCYEPCCCDTSQCHSTFPYDKSVVGDSCTLQDTGSKLVSVVDKSVRMFSNVDDHAKPSESNLLPSIAQPVDIFNSPNKRIFELLDIHTVFSKKFITFHSWPLVPCCRLKDVTGRWVHHQPKNMPPFISPSTSCEPLIFTSHSFKSLSVESLSWAHLISKFKSMHTSLLQPSAFSSPPDQEDGFPLSVFRLLSHKLAEHLTDKSSSNALSVSSSTCKQSPHCSMLQTTPISHTPLQHSAEEPLLSELPARAAFLPSNAPDPLPLSSSRLTCPCPLVSKPQLLLMLLEPVARLAASRMDCANEVLCSSEVCDSLLAAARCPDLHVQEVAAKAAANIACSAKGAARLRQAGASAALQHLARSPSFDVQLAACRALLNLRRSADDLCCIPHPPGTSVVDASSTSRKDQHCMESTTSNLPNRSLLHLQYCAFPTAHFYDCTSATTLLHNCTSTADHLLKCALTGVPLHNCTSTVGHLHKSVFPPADLHNLILRRLTSNQELPGICRCSREEQVIDPRKETGSTMNCLQQCNLSNELCHDKFLASTMSTLERSHKCGPACCDNKPVSSNVPLHKHLRDSGHKLCFHNKLICNICDTRAEVPLLECDCDQVAMYHYPSISSLNNLETSGLMNGGLSLCESSSNFSERLPIYEEGVYPILSNSDVLQLSGSVAHSSSKDNFPAQNPNEALLSQLPFVPVHRPLSSSVSENISVISTDLLLAGKSFDFTSENSHTDACTPLDLSSCGNNNPIIDYHSACHRHENCSVSEQPPRVVDVVLLHGILGGAAWTWRQHDDVRHCSVGEGEAGGYSWCWPRDWLAKDLLRQARIQLRVIAINVAEPWYLCDARSLREEGERLRGALARAGVGQRPLLWLAHSHGGLLLKAILEDSQEGAGAATQPLCNNKNSFTSGTESDYPSPAPGTSGGGATLSSKTVGVVFMSTPHRGTPWARGASVLHPNIPELKDLHPDNAVLGELSRCFERCWKAHQFPVLSLVDTEPLYLCPGISVRPVPHHSAAAGVGEAALVATNHLNICKPRSRSSGVYTAVLNFCLQATSPLAD